MRGAKPINTQRARGLRQSSTDAQRKLWYRLRSRQILDLKFVRQEPIGPYVVDFICREQRLIVEVDGSQHADARAIRCATNGSKTGTTACCDSGTMT